MFVERFLAALRAKFTGQLIGELLAKIDILDAALLQKPASRPALRSTGDLAPVRQDICSDRIRKTFIVAALCERRL